MKKIFADNICRLFYLGLLLLLQEYCTAQSYYTGSVKDRATAALLVGVKITVTNLDSNFVITNTTTNSDGYYSIYMSRLSNIRITASLSGYKKSETSFTPQQLKGFERNIPTIYLDTTIRFDIKPNVPVRQSRDQYVSSQLQINHILPLPAAYDLLLYLNPGLSDRDSLMSNDKIVLPKMPKISNEIKRENKAQFQSDKNDKDGNTQNRLRDTLDKVSRVLADDILNYKIKYSEVIPDSLKLMREYMRTDFEDYKPEISKTSKLKAEGMIQLLSMIGQEHEKIIVHRSIQHKEYDKMKLLWEDLSFLLLKSRYNMFIYGSRGKGNPSGKIRPVGTGPSVEEDYSFNNDEMPDGYTNIKEEKEAVYDEDEVGVFGFIVWSEDITSKNNPDLGKPSNRYVIRYFKPAFADDKNLYELCSRNANVATANLTRAKYGVEVYDTEQKKIVETLYPFFRTDEAFTSKKYDALFIPDFKEIKYILIRLK